MRILYDNLLRDASSIVPSNEDVQYGVANLLISSLSISYKTTNTSTPNITIEWSADVGINCIALAGTNVSSLIIILYDALDNILDTHEFDLEYSTDIKYFDTQSVRKVYLDFTSSDDYTEIGAMSIGKYLQMPNPLWGYSEALEITNKRESNLIGQVYGSDGSVLRTYSPSFRMISFETMNYIRTMIREVRNYKPFFIDMLEYAHNKKQPLYGSLNAASFDNANDQRGVEYGSCSLKFMEVL